MMTVRPFIRRSRPSMTSRSDSVSSAANWLVEDHDRAVPYDRASDANALALTAGKRVPSLADR